MGALACALLAAATVASCGHSPTQIVVVVDSDLPAGQAYDGIEITLDNPSGWHFEKQVPVKTAQDVPVWLGVEATSDLQGDLTVSATAERGGEPIVRRRVLTAFVAGETHMLHVTLCNLCAHDTCAVGSTCDESGACKSDYLSGADLPGWPGNPPSKPNACGASAGDGGVGEGGAPSDSGGGSDGSGTITKSCPAGGCKFTCPNGASCDFTCDGGSCTYTCVSANCTGSCGGGNCSFVCGVNSSCNFSCPPRNCLGP